MENAGRYNSNCNVDTAEANTNKRVFSSNVEPTSIKTKKSLYPFKNRPFRLAIVSKNDCFKSEIKALINNEPRVNICGVYDNLALLDTDSNTSPHIVVVNLTTETYSKTLASIRQLEEILFPRINFVAISSIYNPSFLEQCFFSGVRLVIPKERLSTDFKRGIDAVASRLSL